MKKLGKMITMLMMVTLLFAGCAKGNNSEVKKEVNVPVTDIVDAIKEQIKSDMIEGGVPEEDFGEGTLPGYMEQDLTSVEESPFITVDFNKEDLEEGTVLAPMINIKSDQIFILKAASEEAVAKLQTVLEQVKEFQVGVWSKYLPDQYEKVENNIIKANGKYLLYVTYDNPEKIEEIFDNMLK